MSNTVTKLSEMHKKKKSEKRKSLGGYLLTTGVEGLSGIYLGFSTLTTIFGLIIPGGTIPANIMLAMIITIPIITGALQGGKGLKDERKRQKTNSQLLEKYTKLQARKADLVEVVGHEPLVHMEEENAPKATTNTSTTKSAKSLVKKAGKFISPILTRSRIGSRSLKNFTKLFFAGFSIFLGIPMASVLGSSPLMVIAFACTVPPLVAASVWAYHHAGKQKKTADSIKKENKKLRHSIRSLEKEELCQSYVSILTSTQEELTFESRSRSNSWCSDPESITAEEESIVIAAEELEPELELVTVTSEELQPVLPPAGNSTTLSMNNPRNHTTIQADPRQLPMAHAIQELQVLHSRNHYLNKAKKPVSLTTDETENTAEQQPSATNAISEKLSQATTQFFYVPHKLVPTASNPSNPLLQELLEKQLGSMTPVILPSRVVSSAA